MLIEDLERPDDVEVAAERLCAALALPLVINGQTVVGSASIGVVTGAAATVTAQDLLRQADIAMYDAKRQGKGRYARYAPEMAQATEARRELERDMPDAIERTARRPSLPRLRSATSRPT